MKLSVYLNFKGQAEEAAKFYADALNAPTPNILKFSDMPPNPNFPIPEEAKDFVMHTEVVAGDVEIKFSDILTGTGMDVTIGNNMSITLNFDSDEEITEIYNKLSVDGTVIMPLAPSMWAEKYAYFVDKFGTPWQLNFFGSKVFGQ